MKKEAYRLSKLSTIYAWRGKIVDHVISNSVIPAVRDKKSIYLRDILKTAKFIFDSHRNCQSRDIPNHNKEELKFGGFFETEYGQPLTEEIFDNAWNEINNSIKSLWNNDTLKSALKSADWLISQPKLSFSYNGVTVKATPDVLALFNGKPPEIIDWKVNWNPQRDHWLQLATYAVAVTLSKHGQNFSPNQIGLTEAQLLSGTLIRHSVNNVDEQNVRDLITESSTSMILAKGDGKNLEPSDFPSARYAGTCERCSFKRLCWRMPHDRDECIPGLESLRA